MPPQPGQKPLKDLKPGDGLYGIYRDPDACSAANPWAIKNLQTGDTNGRCHSSQQEAEQQLRALYANLGDKAIFHGADREFTKRCEQCGETKPDAQFPQDGRTKDNLSKLCVDCRFGSSSHGERDFAATTSKPWDGSASRFSDEQYQRACLIDRGGNASVKERCSLPVLEPDGTLNTNALGPAAAALSGGRTPLADVTDAQKAAAARKLMRYYAQAGTDPPDSLKQLAGKGMAALETVDLIGVELMSTGGPFMGSGSPEGGDFFSDDELREIAAANNELAGEIHAPVKVGHQRGQKLLRNSGLYTDEQPAAGWLENYRVHAGKLVADIKDVPRTLAELVRAKAFRKRSVELSQVTSQSRNGKVYPAVVTGLALLGAKAPAIRTLDDIVALYADRAETPANADAVRPVMVVALDGGPEFADEDGNTANRGDTRDMPATAEKKTKPKLSDEIVAKLAEELGITEQDADKRRSEVETKLAEAYAEQTPPAPNPTPPAPAPAPPTPPAPTPPPAQAAAAPQFSEDTIRELMERSERAETLAKRLAEERKNERISATVNAAIRMGKIRPADRDEWVSFAEDNMELAFKHLTQLPVDFNLLTTFGDDGDGNNAQARQQQQDQHYGAFAGSLGIATPATLNQGGSE